MPHSSTMEHDTNGTNRGVSPIGMIPGGIPPSSRSLEDEFEAVERTEEDEQDEQQD